MRFEIDRCRALYRHAAEGIAMLPPRSARCVGAAHDLYGRILDRIEAQGYDVFARRARVADAGQAGRRRPPPRRRAESACPARSTPALRPRRGRGGGRWGWSRSRWPGRGGELRRHLSGAVVAGLATTTTLATAGRWGWARAGLGAAAVSAATAAVERVGTSTGLPFGRYRYTGRLRPEVAGVPGDRAAGVVVDGRAGPGGGARRAGPAVDAGRPRRARRRRP